MTVQQQQQPSSTAAAAAASSSSASSVVNAPKRQFRPLAVYRSALENFSAERQQQRESIADASCDQPLVDEFLEFVAVTGHSHLPWSLIKPVVIWKLQEAETQRDDVAKETLINDAELRDTKTFVMEKARAFDGIPFTIQRLCELLIAPDKNYHGTGTYLRALEKTINVVTTVTEKGMRITGVDDEEEFEKDAPIRVERNFIVSVDEMDEPLAIKLEKHNHHEKRGAAMEENQSVGGTMPRRFDELIGGSDEEKQTKAKGSDV
uniref:Serine/threonine-protein phosphatase 4 regulatory subunit 2 n=1 Tax=Globodera rostochiensis TaxID=31243 RepID=A0A914I8F1_GLORO